jgi:hypothetical protein
MWAVRSWRRVEPLNYRVGTIVLSRKIEQFGPCILKVKWLNAAITPQIKNKTPAPNGSPNRWHSLSNADGGANHFIPRSPAICLHRTNKPFESEYLAQVDAAIWAMLKPPPI